jgi:hypothetical protein
VSPTAAGAGAATLTYTLGAKVGLCCGCLGSRAADAAGEDCCSSNAREDCVRLWAQLLQGGLWHVNLPSRQLRVSQANQFVFCNDACACNCAPGGAPAQICCYCQQRFQQVPAPSSWLFCCWKSFVCEERRWTRRNRKCQIHRGTGRYKPQRAGP